MRRDESPFATKIKNWIKYHRHLFPRSFLFEVKIIRLNDKSFYCRELSQKEEDKLLKAKHDSVVQIHSDAMRTGTICDGSVVGGGGYVFIQKFTIPENKIFYCIDIEDWIARRDSMKRKSMTVEDFKEIGKEYELYTNI
jgi:hypothetical protein